MSLASMSSSFAHSGGLNEDGCHNNRKIEQYHCHQGSKAKKKSSDNKSTTKKKKTKPKKTVPDEGSSPQVKQVERLLKKSGYAPGKVDGVSDATLTKAIKKFQTDNKLKVTGKVSNRLITSIEKRLDKDKPAKKSSSKSSSSTAKSDAKPSADVKKIETLLKQLGYSPGRVDGIENATLTKAIKKFQKDFKLKETGKTSKTLIKSLEKRVKEQGSS
jgi:peptidoglycan hydrolase-like protein with peptidoglycan-binding domain